MSKKITPVQTMTPYYKKQLMHFHRVTRVGWGGKLKEAGALDSFMFEWAPDEVLDYGCGKGAMVRMFVEDYKIPNVQGYDPGVDIYSDPQVLTRSYEMVCCNDVLEHIEPEFINDVLTQLNELYKKYLWLRIDTRPAKKILPDGRNAHLILESPDWWRKKVKEFFDGEIVHDEVNRKGKLDIAIIRQ